jgi:hypothetical protein
VIVVGEKMKIIISSGVNECVQHASHIHYKGKSAGTASASDLSIVDSNITSFGAMFGARNIEFRQNFI